MHLHSSSIVEQRFLIKMQVLVLGSHHVLSPVVGQLFDRHKLPSSSSKLDLEEALHCT